MYILEMLTEVCVFMSEYVCVEMPYSVVYVVYLRVGKVTDTCWHLKEVSGTKARQTGSHSLCLASC